MAKFILWLSVIIFGVSCMHSQAFRQTETQTLAEKLDDVTIALVMHDPDDGTLHPYCTGVWMTKNIILTAEHCVEINNDSDDHEYDPIGNVVMFSMKSDIIGVINPQNTHKGAVVAISKKNDLALITVIENTDHPIAQVSFDKLHDGDEVNLVGHTSGYWWTYMKGYVSSTKRNMKDPRDYTHDLLQLSIPAYKGNSGGGAFDTNGHLVGICSFVGSWPGLSFFVSRDEIVEFLKDHNVISHTI